MIDAFFRRLTCVWLLVAAMAVVTAVYWPGLSGSWLFDDYPNIVDNHGVQPIAASLASLVNAALSSPSSEFKRPLASLSFSANYLVSGLNPYAWKLTNLLIHLLNGILVFVLSRALLGSAPVGSQPVRESRDSIFDEEQSRTRCSLTTEESSLATRSRMDIVAVLIAAGWMLLPINLTGVLYVVQRMESMANLFVLLGLIGYVAGRQRMLTPALAPADGGNLVGGEMTLWKWDGSFTAPRRGFVLCLFSLIVPSFAGMLAKETAAMLPLYALLIEWALFSFRGAAGRHDRRIVGTFLIVLVLPMLIGLAWVLPGLLKPGAWATRDFTMSTRLLSEARIVVDYIRWTLLPTPGALSFYHDDFRISTCLLAPWSTLVSLIFLAGLVALMLWLRARRPLAALGIVLFLGCQLLTGTILSLELVYEHRNYFASFGLMLAVIPMLAVPRSFPLARLRYVLLAGLLVCWTALTAMTAFAWGDPLLLAQDLAARAPDSPRAQYELGRTYIIYSHYAPASPYTLLAYAPLEKAASFPESSILPQQALIFMNSRMNRPLKSQWWDSMIAKLKAKKPGVQDESSLAALTQCARDSACHLPTDRMVQAFEAALDHPNPSARLQASYGDYAWNVLGNHTLGLSMIERAVSSTPNEPAYRITLVRMLVSSGYEAKASTALMQLQAMNFGGRLDTTIRSLQELIGKRTPPASIDNLR